MKLRLGFVSNSSTSSYLLITTKEISDKVLSKMSTKEQGIMAEILNGSRFLGMDIVEYYEKNTPDTVYYNGGDVEDFNYDLDAVMDTAQKWVDAVKKKAPKEKIFVREEEE